MLLNIAEFGYEQLNEAYLPLVGRGKPSKAQVTCGVGLPAAEHFKDTAGPGCNVCSMKEYSSIGGASTKSKNKATDVYIYFSMFRFQPPLPFPIAIAVYTLCRVFSYDFKEAFEVRAVMKPAREISKEIPTGVEFFLTSLLDTDWISIRGKSFYFHCIALMEKKKL